MIPSSKRRKTERQDEALSVEMAYQVLTFTTSKAFHSFSLVCRVWNTAFKEFVIFLRKDITRGAESQPVPVIGGLGVPLFDYATQVFIPGFPRSLTN